MLSAARLTAWWGGILHTRGKTTFQECHKQKKPNPESDISLNILTDVTQNIRNDRIEFLMIYRRTILNAVKFFTYYYNSSLPLHEYDILSLMVL
jgi:hypothetical protein